MLPPIRTIILLNRTGQRQGAGSFSASTPNVRQLLFEKAVARMSSTGEFTHPVSTISPRAGQYASQNMADYEGLSEDIQNYSARERSYCPNRQRLDEFMNRIGRASQEAADVKALYRSSANSLSSHIHYCTT